MKPILWGSVDDNSNLKDSDYTCKLIIEPPEKYFTECMFLDDRKQFDRLILLHGLEPPCYNNISSLILENYKIFDSIYSFDQSVLENCGNSEIFCFGSCWVLTNENREIISLKKDYVDTFNIKDKKFKTSFINSNRHELEGHKLRNSIELKDMSFEVFYPRYRIPDKLPCFTDSMFHISIENSRYPNYFTEKIIDCFITKTIPIYWGCPNISKYFNPNGIITFTTLDELYEILHNLSENDYLSNQDAILENYELSKKYSFFWDRLDDIVRLNKPKYDKNTNY